MFRKKMVFQKESTLGYATDNRNFTQTIVFCFVLGTILGLLTGCEDPHLPETPISTESPNLDEPEVRNRVFDEAINESDLPTNKVYRRSPRVSNSAHR